MIFGVKSFEKLSTGGRIYLVKGVLMARLKHSSSSLYLIYL